MASCNRVELACFATCAHLFTTFQPNLFFTVNVCQYNRYAHFSHACAPIPAPKRSRPTVQGATTLHHYLIYDHPISDISAAPWLSKCASSQAGAAVW